MSSSAMHGMFQLDPMDPAGLESRLGSAGFLGEGERILSLGPAGEGNMNCVLRVETSRRVFVAKQSRPWVEKHPQLNAPWDRTLQEARFYEFVQRSPQVARSMPRMLHVDAGARLIILEYISPIPAPERHPRERSLPEMESVGKFLGALHSLEASHSERESFSNRSMRRLNHDHIFQIPLFKENGLNLDSIVPGLATEALRVKNNQELCRETRRLGSEAYLSDGPCLLHGDPFPGSWLRAGKGLMFIDVEFSFFGRPEFDAAVVLAHSRIAGLPREAHRDFFSGYRRPAGFDDSLAMQFAGVEIIRRVIGYAQLPIPGGLQPRKELLAEAAGMVMTPDRFLAEAGMEA